MKLRYAIFPLILAASSAYAAGWKPFNKDTSTSTFTDTYDYLQFTGPATLTVDSDTSAKAIVFGTGSTVITPANVIINEGKTLTLNELYGNDGRGETEINISGAGNLIYTGGTLKYASQASNTPQYYNYNITGTFSIASKTLNVGNKNYVDLGKVSGSPSAIYMADDSSLKFSTADKLDITTALSMGGTSQLDITSTNTNTSAIKSISMSGSSKFNLNLSANLSPLTITLNDSAELNITSGYVNTTLTAVDGTSFNFNGGGASISGSSTIGDISKVSYLGKNVYIEDNADFVVGAKEGYVTYTGAIIMKAATLTLNTSNAIKNQSSGANLYLSVARSATLNINAAQNFSMIELYRSGVVDVFSIYLNGNSLETEKMDIKNTNKLIFEDFVDGLVKVNNELSLNEDNSVKNVYANINGVETKLYQLDSGYLSLTIPEPAEWAAIFGAVALGLAVYRRRK